MINKIAKVIFNRSLLTNIIKPFSQNIGSKIPIDEDEDDFHFKDLNAYLQAQSRNVMKNYDCILPGIYIRNDLMF